MNNNNSDSRSNTSNSRKIQCLYFMQIYVGEKTKQQQQKYSRHKNHTRTKKHIHVLSRGEKTSRKIMRHALISYALINMKAIFLFRCCYRHSLCRRRCRRCHGCRHFRYTQKYLYLFYWMCKEKLIGIWLEIYAECLNALTMFGSWCAVCCSLYAFGSMFYMLTILLKNKNKNASFCFYFVYCDFMVRRRRKKTKL